MNTPGNSSEEPLRDLYDQLLEVAAVLEGWEHLANPLEAAQADPAKALESPVFDSVRPELEAFYQKPGEKGE